MKITPPDALAFHYRNGFTMIEIPYMLDFDGRGGFVYGRGRAGYTVLAVKAVDVVAFLARLPRESWMPGTHRLAVALAGA